MKWALSFLAISVVANLYLLLLTGTDEVKERALREAIKKSLAQEMESERLADASSHISMQPQELVEWLNRAVESETIDGVRFEYSLKYGSSSRGFIDSRFTMISHDTTPSGLNLCGDGIAAYYKRVNRILEPMHLGILETYISDSPLVDKATSTMTWQQPLGIGPVRKK